MLVDQKNIKDEVVKCLLCNFSAIGKPNSGMGMHWNEIL